MCLLCIRPDMVYIDIESGSHIKLFGKLLTRKKNLLIEENFGTVLTDSDTGIVLQEIKSQTFNNLTISNKKDC